CQRNAFVTLTNSSRTLLWLSTVSLAEAPSSLRGRGNDHVHNDAAKKSRKTRIHRHPDVGRDPDEESARHCAHRPATLNILRRPGARPGSRHKSGAPLRAKPIGVGEQYRCSPPSEPYGRFSRIRLSGQWLSTSRLALKSVS